MVSVHLAGHAYPWDVLGDPAFASRVVELGLTEVTLAAAYHSTRAATPLHPAHQLVDAPYAALYRPVREEAWRGRRLTPRSPEWMTAEDSFGEATAVLKAAGLRVTAWIVLTHSTRLGSAFPELAVTNCFGDRYPYALCPAHPEVREYAATLAAEAVAGVGVDGVSLEACGQLGLAHNSHHEKTEGAWTPEKSRLLSVCCCSACRAAWTARGLDLTEVVHALCTGELPDELAKQLLAVRLDNAQLIQQQVIAGVRAHAPGARITVHGSPDPWATGASPAVPPGTVDRADALLVPAWGTDPAVAELVGRAVGTGIPVEAYVTVLAPVVREALRAHILRLCEAGISGIGLYHLGLAPSWRHALIEEVISLVQAG
jgi:hypothetical protein